MNPSELTPKQQTSEAIRQSETILILTGQHPTVDQTAAVVALAMILRRFGKKATALISDSLSANTGFLPTNELDRSLDGQRDFIIKVDQKKVQAEQMRYMHEGEKLNIYIQPQKGNFAPSDITFGYGDYHYDLAIIIGVPTRARIDKVYQDNMSLFETLPIVNIDYHRSNEQYGAINLIDPLAASLCEMLVALAESLKAGLIDETLATALLGGIMASTDRFTAAHTTSKSLTVAAQMMAAGAKQQAVVKELYRSASDTRERPERNSQRPTAQSGRPTDHLAPRPAAAKPSMPAPVKAEESKPIEVEDLRDEQPTAPVQEVPSEPAAPVAELQENAPQAEPISEVDDEPIIEPAHIEPEPEALLMADFAEAIRVLEVPQAETVDPQDSPA